MAFGHFPGAVLWPGAGLGEAERGLAVWGVHPPGNPRQRLEVQPRRLEASSNTWGKPESHGQGHRGAAEAEGCSPWTLLQETQV